MGMCLIDIACLFLQSREEDGKSTPYVIPVCNAIISTACGTVGRCLLFQIRLSVG